MDDLHLERIGGIGGFGGSMSAIRSTGKLSSAGLSQGDRAKVESLFSDSTVPAPAPDGFRYRITWDGDSGSRTIEVPESAVPDSLKNVVKDRFR